MVEKPNVETKRIKKYLKCDFTREEVEQFAKDLTQKMKDLDRAELEKKSVTKDIARRIALLSSEIAQLRDWVNDRSEYRDVDCEQIINWTEGKFKIVRLDTDESVEDRRLRPEEKQPGLGL